MAKGDDGNATVRKFRAMFAEFLASQRATPEDVQEKVDAVWRNFIKGKNRLRIEDALSVVFDAVAASDAVRDVSVLFLTKLAAKLTKMSEEEDFVTGLFYLAYKKVGERILDSVARRHAYSLADTRRLAIFMAMIPTRLIAFPNLRYSLLRFVVDLSRIVNAFVQLARRAQSHDEDWKNAMTALLMVQYCEPLLADPNLSYASFVEITAHFEAAKALALELAAGQLPRAVTQPPLVPGKDAFGSDDEEFAPANLNGDVLIRVLQQCDSLTRIRLRRVSCMWKDLVDKTVSLRSHVKIDCDDGLVRVGEALRLYGADTRVLHAVSRASHNHRLIPSHDHSSVTIGIIVDPGFKIADRLRSVSLVLEGVAFSWRYTFSTDLSDVCDRVPVHRICFSRCLVDGIPNFIESVAPLTGDSTTGILALRYALAEMSPSLLDVSQLPDWFCPIGWLSLDDLDPNHKGPIVFPSEEVAALEEYDLGTRDERLFAQLCSKIAALPDRCAAVNSLLLNYRLIDKAIDFENPAGVTCLIKLALLSSLSISKEEGDEDDDWEDEDDSQEEEDDDE